MAIACPVDLDTARLRLEIQAIYARVATDPSSEFHFHRGPQYAAEMLGYDRTALAALPGDATASFAGVANPHLIAAMTPGATVVDIGCGAGMDLLLAADAVGPAGRAIGIDMTESMAERARTAAQTLGLTHVEVRVGDALDLPVDSESADFVISNGVLNLTPDKKRAFDEVLRILRPGGQLTLRGHRRGERALGLNPTRCRLVDWLNRRRSAGGRADGAVGAHRLPFCRGFRTLRPVPRHVEGARGT